MRDTIRIEASTVAAQVESLLAAYPELAEDETLLLDTIEAETDLFDVASKLVKARQERRAAIAGLSGYMGDLAERKARMVRNYDGITSLIKNVMSAAGVQKLTLPEATISITNARESVFITDEEQVPSQFCKIIRQPDKDAIGKALKAGEDVPGAALKFGESGLTIRTK
jgi:hypothetical protein